MTCQFVTRAVRTAHRSRPTNRCCDGGFDEDDVLVALSLPVEVVDARRASLSLCEDAQDPATQPHPASAATGAWRRLGSDPLFPICNAAVSNLNVVGHYRFTGPPSREPCMLDDHEIASDGTTVLGSRRAAGGGVLHFRGRRPDRVPVLSAAGDAARRGRLA